MDSWIYIGHNVNGNARELKHKVCFCSEIQLRTPETAESGDTFCVCLSTWRTACFCGVGNPLSMGCTSQPRLEHVSPQLVLSVLVPGVLHAFAALVIPVPWDLPAAT